MKAILVRVGAEPEVIDLPENQDAAFTAMQALVGGYLERFRFFNGDVYCDEDGNPKNLAPNRLGLVGDFVIVGPRRTEIVGLTAEKIEWNMKTLCAEIRMNKVIVLSGVSGSGKSTYAKKLARTQIHAVTIVSADSFFTHHDVYTFDAAKLGEAHAACFREFVCAIEEGEEALIIVDNTNTTEAEISPYMLGAAAFGAEAEIHTMRMGVCVGSDGQYLPDMAYVSICAARNAHGVSSETIYRQAKRILDRRLPQRWKVVEVSP